MALGSTQQLFSAFGLFERTTLSTAGSVLVLVAGGTLCVFATNRSSLGATGFNA